MDSGITLFKDSITSYELALGTSGLGAQLAATIKLLDDIEAACSSGGLVEKGVGTAAREHWYTRAAAALTRFITAPSTRLKTSQLSAVTLRKQPIAYIFAASGYRSMSHLLQLMQDREEDGRITVNAERAAVLLACLCLDDTSDELMDLALKLPVKVIMPLMLGWLNQRAVLTAQGEKNRGRLLRSGHLLAEGEITDGDVPALVNAWMYSSYATEPKKHEIKRWLNRLLAKRMDAAGIRPKPVQHVRKQRPKMVIIHERFTSGHAMFRCYAPMIETLGTYFDTVALVDHDMIDDPAAQMFDSVIRLESPRPAINRLVELVQEQTADIIYYPSLGMSHWTVMLAGLRLAPIQIMTHGHPATSMLNTIDYAYVCELAGDLSAIHSERVINGPRTVIFQAPAGLSRDLPKLLPPSDREVRIAVNSKVMKLSCRLLEICKRIQREAKVPVRFSFFPGERFSYMDGLDAAIRAQLPSATILPYVSYANFLEELCKCDLALAAFPFGNTNSTVDTCLLGLPTVAHFGPESPAQSDAVVLRTAGLPDWLVCDTDEDFFQTALSLVNDPKVRLKATQGLNRQELYNRLINNSSATRIEPFGQVIYNVQQNHQTLREAKARVIDYKDVLEMCPETNL